MNKLLIFLVFLCYSNIAFAGMMLKVQITLPDNEIKNYIFPDGKSAIVKTGKTKMFCEINSKTKETKSGYLKAIGCGDTTLSTIAIWLYCDKNTGVGETIGMTISEKNQFVKIKIRPFCD